MDCEALRDERIGVLYGEADPQTLRRVEEHHALCAACREEMAALRALRRSLSAWKIPERQRPRGTARGLYRLAAAAVILLALGGALGLSGAEVRFEKGPLSVRLGRGGADAATRLAAHERRQRPELEALQAPIPLAALPQDEALLQKMKGMIRESETRQAAQLQASLLDLGERTERQRRYDLARVSAGLSYLEGKTGQQVARTTELVGYVLEAAEKR